jgi:hypothetical protein
MSFAGRSNASLGKLENFVLWLWRFSLIAMSSSRLSDLGLPHSLYIPKEFFCFPNENGNDFHL